VIFSLSWLWVDAFPGGGRKWPSASRLLVANDKPDVVRLDGYRSLTFHVQQSNNSRGETRAGEGRINFLLSFSYVTVARPAFGSTLL
jgi:hypothetical protein